MNIHRPIAAMGQKDLEILVGITERELAEMNAARKRKAAFLSDIQAEMLRRKEEKRFNPAITDHAVLRYLDRIAGMDIDGLRARLLTDGLVSAMRAGASSYTADGMTFKLADNKVITIVEAA